MLSEFHDINAVILKAIAIALHQNMLAFTYLSCLFFAPTNSYIEIVACIVSLVLILDILRSDVLDVLFSVFGVCSVPAQISF